MALFVQMRHHFAEAFFPRLSEWMAASMIVLLGAILTANPTLMAESKTTGYIFMLSIADQPTWAAIMKVFGSVRLVILLVNGLWRRSPYARAMSAVLSLFFWTQIALSLKAVFGLAFGFSIMFLAVDLINIVRAKGRPGTDAVLVSVDSLSALQKAYPNYFADTRVFVELLKQALSGRQRRIFTRELQIGKAEDRS